MDTITGQGAIAAPLTISDVDLRGSSNLQSPASAAQSEPKSVEETGGPKLTASPTTKPLGMDDPSAKDELIIIDTANLAGPSSILPEEQIDGGFTAWGTVVASFVIHFLALGVLYSFGVYGAFYLLTGIDKLSVISWIGSSAAACLVFFGMISGRLAESYGFKVMIFIGACLLSSGLVLASFCTTNSWQLILTQGILFGTGSSIAYFPAVSVPSQWFNKRRSIATGIAVSGSGIGGLAMSLLIQQLLTSVGLAWTLRITAIILFVGICIVLPLIKTRIPPSPGSITDWTVFKDTRFLLILCLVFFATFPSFIPIIYLPAYARTVIGSSASDAAVLISIYNGSSAAGRIFVGVLADTVLGRVNSLVLCGFLSATSILFIWTFATTYPILVLFAVVNGIVCGGFISLFPVVVGQTFGLKRLPSLIGTIMTFSALGNLLGPPLGGLIQSSLGYVGVTIFAGSLTIVSLVFTIILRIKLDPVVFKVV
ncbi:UNVERIFIED_CONTAM: hypothetical protein HDU68_004552 [Siphonaria sp. JEL0065]|nr:hypothetical protein HDU68_004552 [Siphonaria sp. JEL0065]